MTEITVSIKRKEEKNIICFTSFLSYHNLKKMAIKVAK